MYTCLNYLLDISLLYKIRDLRTYYAYEDTYGYINVGTYGVLYRYLPT